MLHAFAERKVPQRHSLGTLSSRTEDDRDSERISWARIIILTTYEALSMRDEPGARVVLNEPSDHSSMNPVQHAPI
jgi:hypothetical protein